MSDLRDRIAQALRTHDIEVDDTGARCSCGGWFELDKSDLDGHLADVAAGVAGPEIAERDERIAALQAQAIDLEQRASYLATEAIRLASGGESAGSHVCGHTVPAPPSAGPDDPVEAAVLTVLAQMHPDVRPQGTGEPLQLAEDARRIAAAVRDATGPRAEAELRALIRDLADPDPCRHDHHGYCQEHGWAETDPPCPHGRAQRLAGEVT